MRSRSRGTTYETASEVGQLADAASQIDESFRNLFRRSMADVATPVTVVTAFEGRRPQGTRVSASASLSRTPPMVLIVLDKSSQLLAVVERTRRFAVNVL